MNLGHLKSIKISTDCDATEVSLEWAVTILRSHDDDPRFLVTATISRRDLAEKFGLRHMEIPTMQLDSWALIGHKIVIWSPGA